jgi:hypothetical protein
MENSLTPSEAEPMLEVYESYIEDNLKDIYTPSVLDDSGLLLKLVEIEGDNLWTKNNPKTQEGFNNRLDFMNETYKSYQEFRDILLKSGKSPFAYPDKAMELFRRN